MISFFSRQPRVPAAPGFTLVELLVTSVIMVPVAFLTISIFARLGELQVERTDSHQVITALRTVQSQLEDDMHRVQKRPVDVAGNSSYDWAVLRGNTFSAVIMRVAYPVDSENITQQATQEWHLYCLSGTAIRFYRVGYFPLNPSLVYDINPAWIRTGTGSGVPSTETCDSSGTLLRDALVLRHSTVRALDDDNTTIDQTGVTNKTTLANSPSISNITDPGIAVRAFNLWGLTTNASYTGGYDLPTALHYELVGNYDPSSNVVGGSPEVGTIVHPIVITSTVTPVGL